MDIDTYQIQRTISRYISLSSEWFTFPAIITDFFLPLVVGGFGLSYFFSFIFMRTKILRKISILPYVFGFALAYAGLTFFLPLAAFQTYVGALMIGFFKYPEWSWKKKIAFAVGLLILIGVLYGFVFPFVFSSMRRLF